MRVSHVMMFVTAVIIAAIAFKRGRDDARRSRAESAAAARQQAASRPADTSRPPNLDSVGATTNAETSVPARDLETIQERLREGAPGTYIDHMLIERSHVLQRWPDRTADPLRVWIQPSASFPDWDVTYPLVAERAFADWQAAGFPIRFDRVRDSTTADIQILFVDRMPKDDSLRIGVARLKFDQTGTIHQAWVTIATHDHTGSPIPAEWVAGTARHEIGHVLGLGHSYRTNDVMFPESRTPVISDFDRATLRLIYLLPPGPVK